MTVALIAAAPPTVAAILGYLANRRSLQRSVGTSPGVPLTKVLERSADRPNLKAMLARVAEGDIGAVVVHKIDRLARNIEDHVAIRAGLRRAGVQLVSVTENIEESASGKLVEGIHALMAEFYSANLATEVRKGMTQKAKQGLWPAKAPIGYLNLREKGTAKRGTAKIVLDPERALLVREAFRMYATGDYSLAELQAALQAKGLTSPTAKARCTTAGERACDDLQNPFYIGIVEWDGVQYEGRHKQLVSRNVFERVQEVLAAHNKAGVRARRHDHYLKGVLYCGQCGNRLSLTLAKGHLPLLLLPGAEELAAPQDALHTAIRYGV